MITTVTLNPAVDRIFIAPDFKVNELNRADKVISVPGGKGINVASTLQILGAEALATGFVGGMTGRFIEDKLREIGVTTNFIHINGETRSNYIILDEKKGRLTQLNEKGPRIQPEEIERLKGNFERALGQTELAVIGGSFPPEFPPEVVSVLIDSARQKEVKTILNTKEENIHRVDRCITMRPFLIKPDIRTTNKLEGVTISSTQQRVKAGRMLLERGVEIVVIGFEEINHTVVTQEKAWEVHAEKSEIINRVGAQDSLLAGLAYILAQGGEVSEAMKLGTAAAIATAKQLTNRPASREEVEKSLAQVAIKEVDSQ